MNKRIKELADQAGVSIMGANEKGVFTLLSDKQKKFAELIVGECVNLLDAKGNELLDKEDSLEEYSEAHGMKKAAGLLWQTYFGVKE